MRGLVAAASAIAAGFVALTWPADLGAQVARTPVCDPGNAGLELPAGFCAAVFAEGLPQPRHMAVAFNGDVFVISNRARGFGPGGRGGGAADAGELSQPGVFRLRDTNGDGKADEIQRVADGTGTGLWIAEGALYAEAGGDAIVRYPFESGTTNFTGAVDVIVSGLPSDGSHFQRNFVVRGGDLLVNVGSATNVCIASREGGPAPDPCTELETRAGIWRFSVTQKNQTFTPEQRYATGFRNAVAMTINPRDGEVYAAQHGRDAVGSALGRPPEYNAENPGEELHRIVEGADYGWPYCYYSHEHAKKVLAPEYGGNGEEVGRCADVVQPIYAFPGHWAPNDILFYTGAQFPAEYREGVFVAFHGSWNRAPLPQEGFNVTFLPMRDGQAAGPHRVFADGFNERRGPGAPATARAHRPTGLAQLPDGSILVSDDVVGTIFRISYRGN